MFVYSKLNFLLIKIAMAIVNMQNNGFFPPECHRVLASKHYPRINIVKAMTVQDLFFKHFVRHYIQA